MDVAKVRSAVEAVRTELRKTADATVEAGKKDSRQYNGLQPLGKCDVLLDKVLEKLDEAIERTAPKPPKEKKAAKK